MSPQELDEDQGTLSCKQDKQLTLHGPKLLKLATGDFFFTPNPSQVNKCGNSTLQNKKNPKARKLGRAFTGWCCIRVCSLANMCFLLPAGLKRLKFGFWSKVGLDWQIPQMFIGFWVYFLRTVARLKALAILWIMLIHSGSPGCCSPKEVMSSKFLCHMTAILTSVHHSIELHRHADTACAVGGEVEGRVLPGFCEQDNHNVETVTYYGVLFSIETTRCFSITRSSVNCVYIKQTQRNSRPQYSQNRNNFWKHEFSISLKSPVKSILRNSLHVPSDRQKRKETLLYDQRRESTQTDTHTNYMHAYICVYK